MKTLTIVILIGLTSSAVAQGTVYFANDASSLIRLSEFSGLPSEPIKGGLTQLVWAPGNYPYSTPWRLGMSPIEWLVGNPGWSLTGLPASIGPTPGLFDGGTLPIPGMSPGDTIQAIVVSWINSPSFGQSLDYAVSAPFFIRLGDPSGTPAAITGPGGFAGLTITLIPEPSAIALLALGLFVVATRRGPRSQKV